MLCKALNHADRAHLVRQGGDPEYTKPSRSRFRCDKCHIHLCVQSYRGVKSCFKRYHEDKSIEGIDYNVKRYVKIKK